MTTAAVAMKRLLISHDRRFGAAFELNLWYLRQQLRLRISARMTIGAVVDDSCRILFKQFSSQRRRAICRPNGFVRRMLQRLGHRLGRVVTINTSDLFGAVGTAILGDVFQVIECNLSELRFFA